MKIRIAPSILSADAARLGDEMRACETGGADLLHVDVMDGRFVPTISVGPGIIRHLKKCTRLPLDVHLMVEEPTHMIDSFVDAGASCITVHCEAVTHLDRALRHIKSRGIRAGVALNPSTPLNLIYYVLGLADMVVVMTVNPGFGGQTFLDYCLPKIEALKGELRHRKLSTLVEVDGGIKLDNVGKIARAGADVIVAGTAVFDSGDYAVAIRDMRTAALNALQK